MKLKNKVAVITGAASGIGRAMTLRFADEGARIVAADLNEAGNEETVRLVQAKGVEAFGVTTNVGSSSAVAELFAQLDGRGWPIDVLVSNAGNSGKMAPVQETSDQQWDAIVDVHLNGTFYCTREAIKRMLPRKQGSIINLGSVAGLRGMPGGAAYTAAKAGIIGFTKGVALEIARFNIRVNCIAPGWIETPILDSLPDKWRDNLVSNTPLGRLGQPEEIASVALFLACEESGFITGQTISPNGGMYT
jgi:NAD(P)-dependent dehydrogenase (short-subunit alcohol dehydrogenase family)